MSRRIAVIAGVERYASSENGALDRAKRVADALSNRNSSGMDEVHPLLDIPASGMVASIRTLLRETEPGDRVFLYYSGHATLGMWFDSDPIGSLRLSGGHEQYSSPDFDAWTLAEVTQHVPDREVLWLMDCSFGHSECSGYKPQPEAFPVVVYRHLQLLWSIPRRKLSLDRTHPEGALTRAFLDGLASGTTDMKRDGIISVSEIRTNLRAALGPEELLDRHGPSTHDWALCGPSSRLKAWDTAFGPTRTPRDLRTKLVLIVEDNADNQAVYSSILRHFGYEVVVANNAEEGISVARARVPDVVLMDISLPGMDGWEASRILKLTDETSHIPIVALTAHALAEDRKRAEEAGCSGYLAKPCEPRRTVAEVERFAGLSQRPV